MFLFCVCTSVLSDDRIVHMESSDVGTYYIDALVDDTNVSMLIDTGSSYTTLTQASINHLHLKPIKTITAVFANGRAERVKIYMIPMIVISNCVLRDVEVAVVSGQINILGLSALRKMSPVTIKLEDQDMIFDCHK